MNGKFTGHDRRRRVRSSVHWPLAISSASIGAAEAVTENLSSDGFLFRCGEPLSAGEMLTCTLSVPAHPHREEGVSLLECTARVVRVEGPDENGLYGAGCHIQEYRFRT